MVNSIRILIVDDELPIREVLSASLRDEGFQVQVASDGKSGLLAMDEFQPQIVFLDIWMPGSLDGLEVLAQARKRPLPPEFVMISGHGTIETAVKATKLGAWDFIEKPLSMDKIHITIANISSYLVERQEKATLLNKLRKNLALLGESSALVSIKKQVAELASSDAPAFVFGEVGTGRHLVAQNLHYMGKRAGRAWGSIQLAQVPENLMEYELFGDSEVRGPGLNPNGKPKIELAAGGTLLIEDFEMMPLVLQERLLRFVRTRTLTKNPLPKLTEAKIDTRIVLSSKIALEDGVERGFFLEEWLQIFAANAKVYCPPLNQRTGDIPTLVSAFGDQIAKDAGMSPKQFSEHSLMAMKEYVWPGNVRELRNFVERVYILTPGDFVDVHDLKFAGLPESPGYESGIKSFREARAEFEKKYLVTKLSENQGNISRTAEIIGLERSYLHRKMKTYGIESPRGGDESP